MDLKEETALGDAIHTHWYYTAKAEMMTRHVGHCRTVLDVGAGSGFFSRWMLRKGLAERAVCVDPGYPEDCDAEEAGRPLAFRRELQSSDADLILMMDVLEHVDDDAGLLAAYLALTPPGARVFITVPAFEFIWSGHDEFLEHRRRYTLARLRRTVVAAGAVEISGHYYFGSVFPLAAAVRLARRKHVPDGSDMRRQPGFTNAVLKRVCAWEASLMTWNKLAGLTVVMLCRR